MTVTTRIEINPRVVLGRPVIRGTRIPVELILRKLPDTRHFDPLVDHVLGQIGDHTEVGAVARRWRLSLYLAGAEYISATRKLRYTTTPSTC